MENQKGFALVETLVAMFLVVVSALALAVTLAGGALINARTADRQQAIAYGEQIIDRMRSLPYDQVGMAASGNAKDQPFDIAAGAATDPGRNSLDWRLRYCPFQDKNGCSDTKSPLLDKDAKLCDGKTSPAAGQSNDQASQMCPQNGRIITLPLQSSKDSSGNMKTTYMGFRAAGEKDPRQAKTTQSGLLPKSGQENSYQKDGLVAYTYVYWPYDRCARKLAGKCQGFLRKSWKVVTVVVRYKDKGADATTKDQKQNTSVQLSTVILDNPGLNQLPEIEQVPGEETDVNNG